MTLFSEKESEYLHDTDFLLTKEEISKKIVGILGDTEKALKTLLQEKALILPPDVLVKAGKISKGENYLGLPYWVLDYPRKFSKEDVFAFRVMVWWGHEASSTLHVGGKHLSELEVSEIPLQDEIFFCINEHPWEYHFETSNYRLLKELENDDLEAHIRNFNFIKISKKVDLRNLESLSDMAPAYFEKLTEGLLNS